MSIEKLDHLSLLEITGDDALTFLQGQLTNDINLADNAWQYSGYCNPKGRLLALFKLWQYKGTVYALIDNSLVEEITKRLRMYVMRSKVTITLTDHCCYGLLENTSSLENTVDINNETLNDINHRHGIYSNGEEHILGYGGRFLYVSANNTLDPSLLSNSQQWLTADITEGLPEVTKLSSELFIPQMLNLDTLNGINFQKGCYTGQEIVARMHYLGKSKQRMFVCELSSSSTELTAGSKVYSDHSLEKSIGNLVSINNDKALAVLRIDNDMSNSFSLDANTSITPQPKQPYSFEEQ